MVMSAKEKNSSGKRRWGGGGSGGRERIDGPWGRPRGEGKADTCWEGQSSRGRWAQRPGREPPGVGGPDLSILSR